MAFAILKTVYSDKNDCTLSKLTHVYADLEQLTQIVRELMGSKLNKQLVENKKILLKPNWVTHSNIPSDELCLRTHDNFLIAALTVVLEWNPASVIVGDAPVQGCNWDKTISNKLLLKINKLSHAFQIPVVVEDFRRVVFNIKSGNLEEEKRPLSDFLIFDVGSQSYLETITETNGTNFRVTNYDSKNLSENHKKGVHKYCIIKQLFDADIVITLPKIKTDRKSVV